jgi:iron complex outermembrane recepter protein
MRWVVLALLAVTGVASVGWAQADAPPDVVRSSAAPALGVGAPTVSQSVQTPSDLKKLSLEELLTLQVTSVSRSPVALADAPSALQVLTNQDIRRSGASAIPEALRLANNLDVAQKNSHDWGISARGFNTDLANKLLVMIDGRTVYTPLFSGVRWDVQDYLLEDVERIEVISGPGGSLWGANAVNGVINLTSKSAKDTQGFYGETGGGNQLREFSSVRYGGTLAPNVYFRVYGKYTRRADEGLASGADVNDSSRTSQGGFRLDVDTATQGKVTAQGDYYHGTEGMPGTGDSRIAGGNLLTRWSQILSGGSDVRLQLYYDRTYLRQPFAASAFGAAGYFTEDLGTYDLDFQQNFKQGENQKLVWGLGYRSTDDRTKDAPVIGFDPRSLSQGLFSGFVQDQFPVGAQALLTVGTKFEHNDYTGFEVEPNLRLQKEFGNNELVWGAVSRAVRAPSRIDRDILEPSKGQTILGGGRDFKSETVIAYEAGYRAHLGAHLIGSVSVFYNDYDDIRSLRPTPATVFPLFFANDLEGETHGLELAFNADLLKWWRLNGGYTLLRTHLHVRPGGVDLNNALNETSDPENQIALGSSMDLPRGIELDANLRWVDTLHDNNNGKVGTVPSYLDLSVRLGFHLSEHLELSVVGQNLLDDQHPEFGTPGLNRVEIRRSVFAKIAWRY